MRLLRLIWRCVVVAPKDFQFAVRAGEKVRVGEMLGDVGAPLVAEGPRRRED